MVQVSIGRSIAQAYGFLFRRILTVIGLSWVAAAFFIVLRKALLGLGPVPHNLIADWPQALEHLGGVIVAVLLVCAIALPLTRAALGEAMEWSLAHFVIGARELRLFAALLRLYLILIAVAIVCALAVAGVGMGTKMALAQWPALAGTGLPVQAIAVGIAAAVAVAAAIYISVRLSFLLYAVAAAEPHARLKRSWELAQGNVLRLFVVALAIALPVYVLFFAADYVLMGQSLVDALHALFAVRPPNQAPLYVLLAAHGWGVATAAGVMVVVLMALSTAASASVYRGLLGLDADETAAVADAAAIVEEAVMLEEMPAAADHPAEPVEHHEAPAEETHDHGETGHGDEAHHDAPAAETHDGHGSDAPAEEHHGEAVHIAEHAEQNAAAHDGHAEDAHEDHGEAEHHEPPAAEAPAAEAHGEEFHVEAQHAEDTHASEAPAVGAHGTEAPAAEETPAEDAAAEEAHDSAAHAEEPHREVEHA